MSCHRHRGFSGLCCFSDVKGNITRYYVPFCCTPCTCQASRRSARPPAVPVRRPAVHAPHSEHTFCQSGVFRPPCGEILPPSSRLPPFLPMPHTARRNPDFLNKRACAHMYTRLIGRSTHFQNLSTRNVAQIFQDCFCYTLTIRPTARKNRIS